MSSLLLELEDVERLCKQSLTSDILSLALSGHLLSILRHHLRTMNDVNGKCLVHVVLLILYYSWKIAKTDLFTKRWSAAVKSSAAMKSSEAAKSLQAIS